VVDDFEPVASKATSKDCVGKLNRAIASAPVDAGVRQRLAGLGFEIASSDQRTPAAVTAHRGAEIGRWWPIIEAADVKPE
jgi:hypothetical protein